MYPNSAFTNKNGRIIKNKNLKKLINNQLRYSKVEAKGVKSNYFGADLMNIKTYII
jgi:hypothetical protein